MEKSIPSATLNVISELCSILPKEQVRSDRDTIQKYASDWLKNLKPLASAVVFPAETQEVLQIVQWARQRRIALIPSGGRTGLSGGSAACAGEIIVSMERMNRILEFDPVERTILCEAGVITEILQRYAAERELYFPVDFASRGSSQIGGNIATNAGGVRVIRYGMIRDWVLGIKVVTGRGDVLDLNRGLIKNNVGYDLRQVFIGSEGTLGFITEATIKLTTPPPGALHRHARY